MFASRNPLRTVVAGLRRSSGAQGRFAPSIPSEAESRFGAESTYKYTRRPPAEAWTLDPVGYHSEEFFTLEKERVFESSWVPVGMVADVAEPGMTLIANVAGQPILVTRDKAGELHGHRNVCRHRGAKLVTKPGRYSVISCPYHRWGYSLDGRLLATPMWNTIEGGEKLPKPTKGSRRKKIAEGPGLDHFAIIAAAEAAAEAPAPAGCVDSGLDRAFATDHVTNFDKSNFHLLPVEVDSAAGMVYARLGNDEDRRRKTVDTARRVTSSDSRPALMDVLGDLPAQLAPYPMDELVVARRGEFDVKANWKLLTENFMEYYHLPSVHPDLCLVSGVDEHSRRQGHGKYCGFVTHPLGEGGTPLDPSFLPPFPGLDEEERVTAVFHAVFPNVFYFLLPSSMFIVRLEPTGPGTTREHATLLVHPSLYDEAAEGGKEDALEAKLEALWEFYDKTNGEDITICESVQEGVLNRSYEGGRVSFRFEETIHRFQNMCIDAMTGRTDRIPLGDECIGFYTGKDSDCVGGISKLNPLKSATVPQERAAGTDCEMMI